ncbi:hypothetical protein BD809_10779 [Aquimarina intermedia]|uniref:Uncharacterized protein n=1 Tax=Aquimarina intermedia TaxID=350814 RepID=A0A5S5BYE7_9FLAO|nr:hypothetical protein BD809_10779 [Aquimarina intermedia]
MIMTHTLETRPVDKFTLAKLNSIPTTGLSTQVQNKQN